MDRLLILTGIVFGSLGVVLLRLLREFWIAVGRAEHDLAHAEAVDSGDCTPDGLDGHR